MARWMMKFAVEAHLGVRSDLSALVFRHPKGAYEVHLQNHYMKAGVPKPLLYAHVVYEADDFDAAAVVGAEHLDGFLNTLGFCTGARFRVDQRLGLYDWTPGISERKGRVYKSYRDPNLPQLVLDDSLTPALECFLVADENEPLRRALRWFASGVAVSHSDEQFQLFWFALETLAQYSSDAGKVPDQCCRCREPLYCPKCKEVSVHRPYPKQKIQQLFAKHLSNDAGRVFLAATAMRNALSHGDKVGEVEAEHGLTLSQLVNLLGQVAWVALFDALRKAAGPANNGRAIQLIQPTTFLHYKVEPLAHIGFKTPEGREPQITDVPDLQIDLIAAERPEGQ